MIILISGTSHTGKTILSQKLLEKYKFPYFSIDHLKMSLIRSNNTELTPTSDDLSLTTYLWPIIKELIKTTIENKQNLIIEGCYIPFDWQKDFNTDYLKHIHYYCLIMSQNYIKNKFNDIKYYSHIIENRLDDECDINTLINDNNKNLELVKKYNLNYILINEKYDIKNIISQIQIN